MWESREAFRGSDFEAEIRRVGTSSGWDTAEEHSGDVNSMCRDRLNMIYLKHSKANEIEGIEKMIME